MNPFTQFLSQTIANRKFLAFVQKWDVVEQIVVNTFRGQGNFESDWKEWPKIRSKLRREYPHWMDRLKPLWRNALIDGHPAREDPFLWLLNYEDASEFRQNWRAMQTLPAAREAINRLLIEMQSET